MFWCVYCQQNMVSRWCSKCRNKEFLWWKYFQTEKYTEVRHLFQERYPERPPPNKTTIWKNVTKYLENATSLNMNKGRSGRKRTGHCQENIDIVQEALEHNPRGISCRKNGLNLPSATFNCIVSKDLNWYPYRMQRR